MRAVTAHGNQEWHGSKETREGEDVIYIFNRILLSHKKNEIMPFAPIWVI